MMHTGVTESVINGVIAAIMHTASGTAESVVAIQQNVGMDIARGAVKDTVTVIAVATITSNSDYHSKHPKPGSEMVRVLLFPPAQVLDRMQRHGTGV